MYSAVVSAGFEEGSVVSRAVQKNAAGGGQKVQCDQGCRIADVRPAEIIAYSARK